MTQRWTSIASSLKPRYHATGAAYNEVVYVFGGRHRECRIDYDDIEQYDAKCNSWTMVAARLSSARFELAAACVNKHIYVIGGCKREKQPEYVRVALALCECFDADTGIVRPIAPLPVANHALAAIAVRMSLQAYSRLTVSADFSK